MLALLSVTPQKWGGTQQPYIRVPVVHKNIHVGTLSMENIYSQKYKNHTNSPLSFICIIMHYCQPHGMSLSNTPILAAMHKCT